MFNTFILILLTAFAAGCGVRAETYVMTKERVGIDYKGGNAGYLTGKPNYQVPEKKTRKIYVLEVSKPVPESEVKKIQQEVTVHVQEMKMEEFPSGNDALSAPAMAEAERPIVIPRIDDGPYVPAPVEQGPASDMTYTVQKDDTLQKIAKKFYNSYGKWMKIYEANKDKIKNPNFVKPGTVLIIPAGK